MHLVVHRFQLGVKVSIKKTKTHTQKGGAEEGTARAQKRTNYAGNAADDVIHRAQKTARGE